MTVAYYNEHNPFAAAWLRELIKAGHIAPGEVDERSIEDVFPTDLRGFTQCHFFAGIGVWSYALRQAGWPDDRPVWTGSCPCQPFSTAGKRKGTADERHLWPSLFHLIRECKPATFFGEQVASKDGLAWFDTVQADLEGSQYTVGATDLCAAGFGAPHIRQRLYFVGTLEHAASEQVGLSRQSREPRSSSRFYSRGLAHALVVDQHGRASGGEQSVRQSGEGDVRLADSPQQQQHGSRNARSGRRGESSDSGELGEPNSAGLSERISDGRVQRETLGTSEGQASISPGHTRGFWQAADWIPCRDWKYRPVEPGTFPLAHGAPARVGRLRGYGNALVAPVAQGFIEAFLEVENRFKENQ